MIPPRRPGRPARRFSFTLGGIHVPSRVRPDRRPLRARGDRRPRLRVLFRVVQVKGVDVADDGTDKAPLFGDDLLAAPNAAEPFPSGRIKRDGCPDWE